MPEKEQTFFWWMMSFTRLQRARSTAALFDYCALRRLGAWPGNVSVLLMFVRCEIRSQLLIGIFQNPHHLLLKAALKTQAIVKRKSTQDYPDIRFWWSCLGCEEYAIILLLIHQPRFFVNILPQIWVTHNLISSGVLNFAGNSKCCHTRSLAWN